MKAREYFARERFRMLQGAEHMRQHQLSLPADHPKLRNLRLTQKLFEAQARFYQGLVEVARSFERRGQLPKGEQ